MKSAEFQRNGRDGSISSRADSSPPIASVLIASTDATFDIVRAAGAGASAPLLAAPGHDPALLDIPAGCPLGLLADPSHATSVQPIATGERLVAFTNGLPGAANAAGMPFSIRRIAEALREGGEGDPQSAANAIAAAVRRHGDRSPRPADATVLIVSKASGLSTNTLREGGNG